MTLTVIHVKVGHIYIFVNVRYRLKHMCFIYPFVKCVGFSCQLRLRYC